MEIRESYDIHCLQDGVYPDEEVPQFRQAAEELAPKLCQLTMVLLKCMALGLGEQHKAIRQLRMYNRLYSN